MGETRDMLYSASDINQAARDRAEMLSVRPSPGGEYQTPPGDKTARNGAIFCLIMVTLLLITWGFLY